MFNVKDPQDSSKSVTFSPLESTPWFEPKRSYGS